jgi:pre-rRNA-processing protein TSR3
MEVRRVCLSQVKANYLELSEEEGEDEDDEEESSDLTEEEEDDEKGSGEEDDDEEEDEEDDDEEEEAEQVTIGVPVGMWDFDHCDPKRCSGKKLERHRLMTSLRVGSRFRGIVLSYVSSSPSCDVYAEQ